MLFSLSSNITAATSDVARQYGISNGNGGQVLKEAAEKQGIEVNKLDGCDNSLP